MRDMVTAPRQGSVRIEEHVTRGATLCPAVVWQVVEWTDDGQPERLVMEFMNRPDALAFSVKHALSSHRRLETREAFHIGWGRHGAA